MSVKRREGPNGDERTVWTTEAKTLRGCERREEDDVQVIILLCLYVEEPLLWVEGGEIWTPGSAARRDEYS